MIFNQVDHNEVRKLIFLQCIGRTVSNDLCNVKSDVIIHLY